MKTPMKTVTAITSLTLAFAPFAVMAEGKGDHDWAEKAARGYEEKANKAEKKGQPEAAAIYRRMAQIKRDAGKAAKHGKDFSWEEYHQLEGKLHAIKKEHRKHQKHADHAQKKGNPGEGFLRTAEKYRKEAEMAREHGDTEKADILMQLAKHKLAAAQAAQAGKGYDWSEYHKLRKKLHGKHDKHVKDDKKRHHDKPQDKDHDKPHDKADGGKFNIE